jgi:hypothetical protein
MRLLCLRLKIPAPQRQLKGKYKMEYNHTMRYRRIIYRCEMKMLIIVGTILA